MGRCVLVQKYKTLGNLMRGQRLLPSLTHFKPKGRQAERGRWRFAFAPIASC